MNATSVKSSLSAAFFAVNILLLALSMTCTMRRRSLRAWIGAQSTILFRQYNEKLRTKKGTNGRRKSRRRVVDLYASQQKGRAQVSAVPEHANRMDVFILAVGIKRTEGMP